ncbi:putative ribosome biogenesis protein [Dissostichus eleginoides]|uniref:Ribosome biogenesis protein n=1 Tax=Dissostichus eleginoides TaxID=100907 RepID=A0AAD9CAK3_DISEL|nr:putative ribosome biogenesis protein [Dissostichus eleginoides]
MSRTIVKNTFSQLSGPSIIRGLSRRGSNRGEANRPQQKEGRNAGDSARDREETEREGGCVKRGGGDRETGVSSVSGQRSPQSKKQEGDAAWTPVVFATADQVVLDPTDASWDAEDDRGELRSTSSSLPKANVFLLMRCPGSDEDYIVVQQLRDFCA